MNCNAINTYVTYSSFSDIFIHTTLVIGHSDRFCQPSAFLCSFLSQTHVDFSRVIALNTRNLLSNNGGKNCSAIYLIDDL